MKIKDLPENANLQTIKVKLSDALYNASSLPSYKIETKEVYLHGPLMGDFFVKIKLEDSQIYPMFRDYITWDELKELEIIQ